MAATGYSPIQLYYSTTASTAPTAGNLASGELAINITDGKLYYKDNAGAVQLLSTSTTANGTANGVLYLNGSKVATAGSALTFDGTNLTASGYIGAGSYLNVSAADGYINFSGAGTASAPAGLSYGSFLNSGVGLVTFSAASQAFWANSTEQMRLTSTGLGIGTSAPTARLTLQESAASPTALNMLNRNSTQRWALAVDAVAVDDKILAFIDQTNSAVRMALDSSGNLGIGTSSPENLLQASSRFGVSSSGVVRWGQTITVSGRANSGYLTWDTGLIAIGYEGAGAIAFQTNSAERMRLDSSGNLGIGTSSPVSKLDVAETATIKRITSGNNMDLNFYNGSGSGTAGNVARIRCDGDGVSNDYGALSFWTGRIASASLAERMRLDSSGNLGLGVTPSAWSQFTSLQVGKTAGSGVITNYNGGSGNNIQVGANYYYNGSNYVYGVTGYASRYIQTDSVHQWYTAPSGTAGAAITFTQAMTLDASGNLGVGTTSAAEKLTVLTGTTYAAAFNTTNTASATTRISIGGLTTGSGGAGGTVAIGSAHNHTGTAQSSLTLYTHDGSSLAERARIDSSGNLLVGQTSQSQTGLGFSVVGSGGGVNSGTVSCGLNSSSSSQVTYVAYSTSAAAYRFYVDMAGTVHATNTTITGISDVRLKENIRDLDDGLDVVMALKPRKFDWKEGKGQNIKNARGFIAQEFEQVLPDMVEEWRDPAPEGEDPYKAVNANLIPTLVKALQEQQAQIESLRKRLADAGIA